MNHNTTAMSRTVYLIVCMIFFFSFHAGAASQYRSDTLDIRKTIIKFTITDFVTKNISAHTRLDVKSKVNNLSYLLFDLEGLQVDSVKWQGLACTYSHLGMNLQITLPAAMSQNDTALVDVYYRGVPLTDATWGGFYFVGNYGFQMGVGFNAQPHSFGRTWHPCFDNFVERSSYEFFITTTSDKMAVCNGLLQDSTLHPDNTITWHWNLEESLPSYLASVAVCQYVMVSKVLQGSQGNIPAHIACEAVDTTKVQGSFAHLQESFTMLEQSFGNHQWPRVGYSLVPFNAGAMEHATNIHIGKAFIDGTLNYETLIAHELAHHWWGDLVTCSTAGDMWLNEGFASYCEFLHQEYTYGTASYQEAIRQNHYKVLSSAHITDNGYRSVANMDSNYTYGPTVYLKGADMIHTLRSYMGDSAFFAVLTQFVQTHPFQPIHTTMLKDYIATHSSVLNNHFFSGWIEQKGFPHFSIDSVRHQAVGGGYEVTVSLRQRQHQNPQKVDYTPFELAFYSPQFESQTHRFSFWGECTQFKIWLPFIPAMVVLDPLDRISDASTQDTKMIKSIGTINMPLAKSRVICKSMLSTSDSTLLHITHHWRAPDRFQPGSIIQGYHLSDTRYWTVEGVNTANISSGLLHFVYDAGANNSYLDSTWINNTEDSIRLFYRRDAGEDWQFANDSLRTGAPNDRYGNIYALAILPGEYCLGIKKATYLDPVLSDIPSGCQLVLEIPHPTIDSDRSIQLYPNPTQGQLHISGLTPHHSYRIEVTNTYGKRLQQFTIKPHQQQHTLEIKGDTPSLHFIHIFNLDSGKRHIEKCLLQ